MSPTICVPASAGIAFAVLFIATAARMAWLQLEVLDMKERAEAVRAGLREMKEQLEEVLEKLKP